MFIDNWSNDNTTSDHLASDIVALVKSTKIDCLSNVKCQMPGMTIILLSLLGVCQIVNKLLGRFIQGQKVIKFHFLK